MAPTANSALALEVLWLRLLHTPAEPGVRANRWKDVLDGRKRSGSKEDEGSLSAEDWEKLCGPLASDVEAVWAAMPDLHASRMQTSEVVAVQEAHRATELVAELCAEAHTFDDALADSRRGRLERRLFDESWSYSECDHEWFMSLLLKLKRIHGHLGLARSGTFVDCGSGYGKNCFIATLAHSWQRCIGIESIETLHRGARALLERYNEVAANHLSDKERDERDYMEIEFINENFFTHDIVLTGSLIFVDLTSCHPAHVDAFHKLADEVTHGAVVVTLTRPLVSDRFFLLWEEDARTSWGPTRAFVFERKPPPESLAGSTSAVAL